MLNQNADEELNSEKSKEQRTTKHKDKDNNAGQYQEFFLQHQNSINICIKLSYSFIQRQKLRRAVLLKVLQKHKVQVNYEKSLM